MSTTLTRTREQENAEAANAIRGILHPVLILLEANIKDEAGWVMFALHQVLPDTAATLNRYGDEYPSVANPNETTERAFRAAEAAVDAARYMARQAASHEEYTAMYDVVLAVDLLIAWTMGSMREGAS